MIRKQEIDKAWARDLRWLQIYGYVKPLRLGFRPRRFHAFAVGTPKSGTHSIHGLFDKSFRSQHEPSSVHLNKLLIDYRNKRVTDTDIARFYRYRDRSMRIEMESNCFNAPFIHILADVFPRARYVLTLRPFRAWLGSWINHTINRPEEPGSIWAEALHALYRPEQYQYGVERRVFEPLGLFPIRCYADFWLQCNDRLLNSMPAEQMMVTLTTDIDQRPERLARFLDIDCAKLDTGEGHRFRAAKDHKILDQINHDFLEDLVAETETYPSVKKLYALAR